MSPALQADSLTAEPPGMPLNAGFLGKILFCLLSLDERCLCEAQHNHVKGAYTTSSRSEAPPCSGLGGGRSQEVTPSPWDQTSYSLIKTKLVENIRTLL